MSRLDRRKDRPSGMTALGLPDALADWTDWDVAEYELARALGLLHEGVRFQVEAKHVFWSNNPIGTMLHETLQRLVEIDVLDHRAEPDDQYRWNPDFRGSWEKERPVPPSTEVR